METNTASPLSEGIPLTPETDPVVIYAFVGKMYFKENFDAERAAHILHARGKRWHRRAIRCGEKWLMLRARQAEREGFNEYVALSANGEQLARLMVSDAYGGFMVAEEVTAEPGCEGAVANVLSEVAKDALRVGARLLPSPPGYIGDVELRAWWEVDRLVVAYYGECSRLGLMVESEEAEDLEYLRHYIPAVRIRAARKRIVEERGADGLAYIEQVGVLLAGAKESGCRNAGDMARWLNNRGVGARSSKGWTEHSVRDVAREFERATGLKVLRWGRGLSA